MKRIVQISLGCLIICGSVRAENGPPSSALSETTPLSAAQRSFENFKSQSTAPDAARGLPVAGASEFIAPPARSVETSLLVRSNVPTPKPATNWLVEGVMKKKAADGEESQLSSTESESRPELEKARDRDVNKLTDPLAARLAPEVSNPLDRFMESWLSSSTVRAAPPESSTLTAARHVADSDRGFLKGTDFAAGLRSSVPPAAAIERSNPYLTNDSGQKLSVVAVPVLRPRETVSPLLPAPSESSLKTFAAPNSSIKPAVPTEVNRSGEEQKYFKQMKRF